MLMCCLKCIVQGIVKECGRTGMWVQDRATVTATQCECMGNRQSGVYMYCDGATTKNKIERLHDAFRAVVDLHGTKKQSSIPTSVMVFVQYIVVK